MGAGLDRLKIPHSPFFGPEPQPDTGPQPGHDAPGEHGGDGTETGTPVEKVRGALLRYRILAWITGLWLLLLVAELILKYGFDNDSLDFVPIVHGWVYFAYLLFTANLAVKVRWPIGKTIGVLLAGTIPLLGIVVEHYQTKNLKARFGL